MPSKPPDKPGESPAPDWRTMHLWHIQPVRDMLVILVVIGLIYLGYVLRPVTVPMLLALMLAYLFEPLVKRLTRIRRVTRPIAVGGILATFIIVVVIPLVIGLGFGIVQTANLAGNVARNTGLLISSIRAETPAQRAEATRELPQGWRWISRNMNELRAEVEAYHEFKQRPSPPVPDPGPGPAPAPSPEPDRAADAGARPLGGAETTAPEPAQFSEWKLNLYAMMDRGIDWIRANAEGIATSAGQQAISSGADAARFAIGALLSVFNVGMTAFLTGFFFFFFSVSWGGVLRFSAEFIPRDKRSQAFDLLEKMDAVIAGFVRGRLTICAILGLLMVVAYWLIGVPMPLVMGLVVGALFIVPFIHVLGVPVAMLLLWLDASRGPLATMVGGVSGYGSTTQATWWWILFAPLGVYLLAQFLDDWVLSPLIAGKATDMDTPTILFASLAGGVLAGLYGVLLAIPVAACIKILIKDAFWPRFKAWAAGKSPDFLPIQTAQEEAGASPPPKARRP
ncbi:MAG: AI-2E family transporter [Phycisphaerales bacterium]